MKILVLGHNGMLGNMITKFLHKKNYLVITTEEKWPNEEFVSFIKKFDGDYIINCIGAIPQKTKAFDVNSELPKFLEKNSLCRIIHPGTDCEMDTDEYGVSKKIARDYIINNGIKTKIIKTSIIGPEIKSKFSLMEWLLSQSNNASIFGFSEFYWNGNTTLTWSKICFDLINNWDSFDKETIISSDCISKYELLLCIKEVFNKEFEIKKLDEPKKNKCLNGKIKMPHIKEQLIELKNFIENN